MNPHNTSNPRRSASAEEYGSGGSATGTSGTLTETKNKVAQTTRDAAAKVKGAAGNTAARAKEEAARLAAEKKEAAASRLGSYSSAMHDTAQSFEDKDPNIAWFTHQAADKLQNIAEYVRNRDFGAFRNDAEDMARRHPGAFFGGMFIAGLLVGNLVKASRRKMDEDQNYSGYEGYRAPDYGTDWSQSGGEVQTELSDTERSSAGI